MFTHHTHTHKVFCGCILTLLCPPSPTGLGKWESPHFSLYFTPIPEVRILEVSGNRELKTYGTRYTSQEMVQSEEGSPEFSQSGPKVGLTP